MIPFDRLQTDYPQTSGNLSVCLSGCLTDDTASLETFIKVKGCFPTDNSRCGRTYSATRPRFRRVPKASLQSSNGSKLTFRRVTSRSRSDHHSLKRRGSEGALASSHEAVVEVDRGRGDRQMRSQKKSTAGKII